MATVQDYRQAKRIGQISLTNLIARNIAEGGGFGSVGKAISQKFAARKTRIKEAFDPLNIASMLVGRTKLGTAILGRMMGRSAEDIQYFARKGAGREAAYDPFFARVSPGSLQPVKQNEGVADVFAKIYNLLKKNIDDETKRREVEKNFREEQSLEDERRFKELLAAITGSKRPSATPVEKKEGGLLDFIKGMLGEFKGLIGKIKDGLSWLYTALTPVFALFKQGLISILKALVNGGSWLLKALLSPVGMAAAIGAIIIGAYMAMSDAEVERLREAGGEEGAKLAGERQTEEALGAMDASSEGSAIMGAAEGKKSKTELIKAAIEKKQKLREKFMVEKGYKKVKEDKNGVYLFAKEGKPPPVDVLIEVNERANAVLEGRKPSAELLREEGALPEVPEIFRPAPAGTESKGSSSGASMSPASTASPTSPPTASAPAASPMPSTPSMPPVMTATNQNMELQDEMNVAMSNAPMIFNKSSTNGINLGGQDAGTATGAAPVRNDSLDNIMSKLQRRSSVM